jgi:hypothetical protein
MKTPWITLAVVAAVGLLVSSAGAAVVTVHLELAPGEDGRVSPQDGNVLVNVYATVTGVNGSTADDGIQELYGSLKSSNGGLQGNLGQFVGNAGLQATGYAAGTSQNLDTDTDMDLGSNNAQAAPGWIHLFAGAGATTYVGADGQSQVLLGQAIFTLSDSAATLNETTLVNWNYRAMTGLGNKNQFYVKDGLLTSVAGADASLAVGSPLAITFVPEPATMAILGLGSLVSLFIRRKRSA